MRPYSPGGALNALAQARKGVKPPTPSAHRLRLGLQGYLIPFATLTFVHERQYLSREAPSPPVFHLISRISPLHQVFPSPLQYSSSAVSNAIPRLSRGLSHLTHRAACGPFTPSKSEQRSPPLYYRGCWHRVSRDFLCRYYQIEYVLNRLSLLPADRSLQPKGRLPPRGVACSHFRALTMILDCSLP